MKRASYEEIGLPVFPGGRFTFSGLQYCGSAEALLVTLRSKLAPQGIRVYVRTREEGIYREVVPNADEEFWAAFVCEDAAFAFLSAMGTSANGLIIYRCELPIPTLHRLPSPQIPGEHARLWLSALHGASSDGLHILVTAAIQPKAAADGSYEVRFVLAKMDVASGRLDIVAALPATFA